MQRRPLAATVVAAEPVVAVVAAEPPEVGLPEAVRQGAELQAAARQEELQGVRQRGPREVMPETAVEEVRALAGRPERRQVPATPLATLPLPAMRRAPSRNRFSSGEGADRRARSRCVTVPPPPSAALPSRSAWLRSCRGRDILLLHRDEMQRA